MRLKHSSNINPIMKNPMKSGFKLTKQLAVVLLLGVVAGGVLLSGCSKSKPATNAGNGTGPASGEDSAMMKVKWTAGKKYSMRMELAQTTKTQIPNQPQPNSQEVNLSQNFDISAIKDLDNGGKELELQFGDMTIDVTQGGQKVLSYDSTQSATEDTNFAPMFHAMVGSRLQYFTDADGKVEKVEGIEEMLNRISTDKKSPMRAQFSQMFTDSTIKEYGSFADMMPNRVVKTGESWSYKRDVVTQVSMALDMKYTFKSWEQHLDRKCARIGVEGKISSKGVSNGMQIDDGKISGDVWFDPELGMIVGVNNDQNIKIKVTTRGMTVTPEINQRIRVSLVDIADVK